MLASVLNRRAVNAANQLRSFFPARMLGCQGGAVSSLVECHWEFERGRFGPNELALNGYFERLITKATAGLDLEILSRRR